MPPDETHPIYTIRKQVGVKALTCDATQRYYNEFFTPEMTEKRRKRIDANVKRKENQYYNRIIRKIKALRHDDVPAPKPKKTDTRSAYWIAVDKAVAEILRNDPVHQKWLSGRDERRKLSQDATEYHNFLMHNYWEIKELGKAGYPEPPKGDASMRARWEEHNESLKLPKTKHRTKVDEARRKLSQVFDESHAKRLNPQPMKPGAFMIMASGSPEEE